MGDVMFERLKPYVRPDTIKVFELSPKWRTEDIELGIKHLVQGSGDKAAALAEFAKSTGIALEHMAYIGDDWPDIAPMKLVGFPIAVADATAEVRAAAAWVTTRPGGFGAVREAVEMMLRGKGIDPLAPDSSTSSTRGTGGGTASRL